VCAQIHHRRRRPFLGGGNWITLTRFSCGGSAWFSLMTPVDSLAQRCFWRLRSPLFWGFSLRFDRLLSVRPREGFVQPLSGSVSSIEKLAQLKKDRALANRFLRLEDGAAALVDEATGLAAPVRRDLKATNDELLRLLELQVQGEGFDGIKLVMDGKTFYMKRKNSRSARVCRLTHLEEAYDSLTMAHLLVELESDEHATPTQLFCRAVIKRLRENEDLFSESQQLVLDKSPIEKKRGAEGPVCVADADQRVYELVQRRRERGRSVSGEWKATQDSKRRWPCTADRRDAKETTADRKCHDVRSRWAATANRGREALRCCP